MDEYESPSHTKWECKYQVVFIPKGRRRVLYGQLRQHLGGGVASIGGAEGESGRGRAFDVGSRAHDAVDSAEVCGVQCGRIHKREECDALGTGIRGAEAQFRGAELLGPWVFCANGGSGRDGDPRVHPEPRAGGQALGPAEPVAMIGHRQRGQKGLGPR